MCSVDSQKDLWAAGLLVLQGPDLNQPPMPQLPGFGPGGILVPFLIYTENISPILYFKGLSGKPICNYVVK